jgi:hypothetical protein
VALLTTAKPLWSQNEDEWRQDIDTLAAVIERHHPKPWERIAREDFMLRKEQIKDNLTDWRKDCAQQPGRLQPLVPGQNGEVL